MDSNSRAEDLPALYRAILDRVAILEAAGERAEAARVRSQATTTYSRAWNERARRELEGLLRRAERPTAAEAVLGRGRGRARRVGRAGRRQTSTATTTEG
jgi:hypothetical protein